MTYPIRVTERNKLALDILMADYRKRTAKLLSYDDMLTMIMERAEPRALKRAEIELKDKYKTPSPDNGGK